MFYRLVSPSYYSAATSTSSIVWMTPRNLFGSVLVLALHCGNSLQAPLSCMCRYVLGRIIKGPGDRAVGGILMCSFLPMPDLQFSFTYVLYILWKIKRLSTSYEFYLNAGVAKNRCHPRIPRKTFKKWKCYPEFFVAEWEIPLRHAMRDAPILSGMRVCEIAVAACHASPPPDILKCLPQQHICT